MRKLHQHKIDPQTLVGAFPLCPHTNTAVTPESRLDLLTSLVFQLAAVICWPWLLLAVRDPAAPQLSALIRLPGNRWTSRSSHQRVTHRQSGSSTSDTFVVFDETEVKVYFYDRLVGQCRLRGNNYIIFFGESVTTIAHYRIEKNIFSFVRLWAIFPPLRPVIKKRPSACAQPLCDASDSSEWSCTLVEHQ